MRKLLLLFLLFCGVLLSAAAQQKTVTGTVVSSVEGEGPLPGVTVIVKGTTTGTIADVNGKFTIVVPQGATTLVFSYIGMKTRRLRLPDVRKLM